MKKLIFVAPILLGILLGSTSCAFNPASGIASSEGSTVATESSATEHSTPTRMEATPTPTPMPTPTPIPFTFDLTEEVSAERNPVKLVIGMDTVIVVGGNGSSGKINSFSEYNGIYNNSSSYLTNGLIEWDYDYFAYTLDRSAMAISLLEDPYKWSSKSTPLPLLYYDGDEFHDVAERVNQYEFCRSGNAILYRVEADGETALYRYDAVTGESQCLLEFGRRTYFGPKGISPSGDAVAYKDAEGTFHVVSGKTDQEIDLPGSFVAISDGGEIIYYTRYEYGDNLFFAYTNGEHKEIVRAPTGTTYSGNEGWIFNRDLTQVLIASDNKLWFSKDGSEGVCIAELPEVIEKNQTSEDPDSAEPDVFWDFTCLSVPLQIREESVIYLSCKNLIDQLYRFSNTILYLDQRLGVRYLTDDTAGVDQLSALGGDLFAYLKLNEDYNGYDVFSIANFREAERETKVPVEFATNLLVTENQSLYIENDIGQIFVVKGGAEPVLVDTYSRLIGQYEVDGTTYMYYEKKINFDRESYYWKTDLYCVEDVPDAKPEKVLTGNGQLTIDETGVYVSVSSDHYFSYEEYEWYTDILYARDGKNFTYLCTFFDYY